MDERTLEAEYDSLIVPYLRARAVTGETRIADGASLAWQKIAGAGDRILVVLGGHSESYRKYAEFFYDLRDLGASIFALDLRGQGFSSRMLPDREKDHVEDYHQYLTDLERFMSEVVRPESGVKVVLLASSMGAAVAASYAERHPDQLSGLILCSPFFRPKASPIALCLVRALDLFGMGRRYVFVGGPFRFVAFEENRETHSRIRHERKMQDYVDAPAIRLGHPTNHWFVQLGRLGKEARKNARAISSPLLLLQAGKDEIADPRTQDDFCAVLPGCDKLLLPEAYHELLIETDTIRNVALDRIRSFLREIWG